MKFIGKLVKVILVLVVLALAIVVTLPLWLGPVVKPVANKLAPNYTKTAFHLGDFGLTYGGFLHLGDLEIGNPAGYSVREALTLGKLEVEVDPLSLLTEVIHVKRITVKDAFVSYLLKDGVSNFDQLLENCKTAASAAETTPADDVKATGEVSAKKEVSKSVNAEPQSEGVTAADEKPAAESVAEPAAEKSEKKVIIDRIEISGVVVQMWTMKLPAPSITLKDIGKEANGLTLEAAWLEVSAAVMKSLGIAGGELDALGKLGLKLGDEGLELGNKGIKIGDKGLKLSDEALKDGLKGLKGLFGK